jgi:hypothetical protein
MSFADEEGYWEPLEDVWNTQPSIEGRDEFLTWFDGLSDIQRILFPTHWLCAEVYNGGFHQYFHNGTGLHAPEAVVGFRKLGLEDIAEIVERAMSVFGPELPRKREDIIGFLDSIEGDQPSEWDPFFELNDEFYAAIRVPGAPDLSDDNRFTVAAKELVVKKR